ncbi:MAG: hypothetical protein AB8U44_00105 [Aaplasma endosymbiont of Hyalomma asiaticum]
MSFLRLMMLSYLFFNFDKIFFRFLFLFLYSYTASLALLVYFDGLQSIFFYKNPVHLYTRMYHIIKWYYYNKDAITTGLMFRIVPIMLGAYFFQSYIWNIDWKAIPARFFGSLFSKGKEFYCKNYSKESDVPQHLDCIKTEFMLKVDGHISEVISEVMEITEEITSEELAKIKKLCSVKIGFAIEELIKGVNNAEMSRKSGRYQDE